MKAARFYGQNDIRIEKISMPRPQLGGLLVKVEACAICGTDQSKLDRRLNLDHDHETGGYRGLLCDKCNLIAGSSEKQIHFLEKITDYLKGFYNAR